MEPILTELVMWFLGSDARGPASSSTLLFPMLSGRSLDPPGTVAPSCLELPKADMDERRCRSAAEDIGEMVSELALMVCSVSLTN